MKKIKIGIFIRDFKDLSDTEFRIYQTLLEKFGYLEHMKF